ncbi:4'-phosphopantetheinyl transferase family protein [Geodermatophilus sp. SYSU D00804]
MVIRLVRGASARPDVASGPAPVVLRVIDLADPRWDVAAEAGCLDDVERARAERGTAAVRRRRVLVRACLRRVLGDLLGTGPAGVPLRSDDGRPFLPGDTLRFSCSASEDLALVAVARRGLVGVDVQRHRPEEVRDAADEDWLAETERVRLRALRDEDRPEAVTRAWTQKEAVVKARGTGIRRSPVDLATPVADRGQVGGLHVSPVPVRPGYVASLATSVPLDPDVISPVALTPGGRR